MGPQPLGGWMIVARAVLVVQSGRVVTTMSHDRRHAYSTGIHADPATFEAESRGQILNLLLALSAMHPSPRRLYMWGKGRTVLRCHRKRNKCAGPKKFPSRAGGALWWRVCWRVRGRESISS